MGKKLKLDLIDEITGIGNITLEIKVEHFSTTSKFAYMFHGEKHRIFLYHVRVVAGSTDDWLAVFPEVKISNKDECEVFFTPNYSWWTVSIIDTEGKSRFPQYFDKYPDDDVDETDQLRKAKYLEKSFIVDRANDLLSKDVLRLRCDIHFDLNILEKVMVKATKCNDNNYSKFLDNIPQLPHSQYSKIFNFTFHNLNLNDFKTPLEKFISLHSPYVFSSNDPESKYSPDILKDIWMIDTNFDRFLLSFSKHPGNLGRFLIATSPVIRKCINASMKEQGNKLIDLLHVDSETFKMVMYFLESGRLPICKFQDLLKVYEFSHLYLMENLQLISAKCLLEGCESADLEKIKEIADLYLDEYLLKLLEIRRHENEFGNSDTLEYRLDSDCYI